MVEGEHVHSIVEVLLDEMIWYRFGIKKYKNCKKHKIYAKKFNISQGKFKRYKA